MQVYYKILSSDCFLVLFLSTVKFLSGSLRSPNHCTYLENILDYLVFIKLWEYISSIGNILLCGKELIYKNNYYNNISQSGIERFSLNHFVNTDLTVFLSNQLIF
jgi:hypothetical protein